MERVNNPVLKVISMGYKAGIIENLNSRIEILIEL